MIALEDPATELVRTAETQAVDLIAMSTHGHRFLNDLIHGANERCHACGNLLGLPVLAFGVIVPSDADYVCVKCRLACRWIGNPPRLTLLTAPPRPDDGAFEDDR